VAWLQEQEVKCPTGITPRHIRAHLVGLQRRGLRDTTQHAHARAIKTWLNWLSQEEVLEVSPRRKVPMARLEKRMQPPFAPEDMKALPAVCDRTPKGLRARAMILGLLDSGLGASEFVSLKVDDVDMRTGLVTVVGKGNKQRQVRLGVKTRKSILKYLAGRK
jgi:site-specific recombinase XerD